MGNRPHPDIPRSMRLIFGGRGASNLPDAELLGRFVRERDEAAFELLAWRHAGLVWGVCRRVLRHQPDVEDAFQAALLLLARKAGSIGRGESVGGWLHKVAFRCALAARADRARHDARAVPPEDRRSDDPVEQADRQLVRRLLDEEVDRLPARYREAVVLCDLEGLTAEQAAGRLGCPPATVATRLRRARERLRGRLVRRGVSLAAAPLAGLAASVAAEAAPPGRMIGAIFDAVKAAGAGRATAAGILSGRAIGLAEGMVWTMSTRAAMVAGAAALVCFGGTAVAYWRLAGDDPPAAAAKATAAAPGGERQRAADPRVAAALDAARTDAESIDEPFPRAIAYGLIAGALARNGRREEAAATLRRALADEDGILRQVAGDQKDSRLIAIAEAFAKSGDAQGALAIAADKVSDANRDEGLARVAAARASAGDIKGAREIAAGSRGPHREEALAAIGVAQVEAGDADGAMETAGLAQGEGHARLKLLATVAVARARGGDRDGAATLVTRIREALPADGPPSFVGLSALANAQAAAGRHDDARESLAGIDDDAWRARGQAALAAAQVKLGDLAQARTTAGKIAEPYDRGEAMKAIVVALLGADDLAGARREAEEIAPSWGKCYALMEVAKALAAGDRRDEARSLLAEAGRLAESLDDAPDMGGMRESALADIAGARAAIGDADAALAWARGLDDPWTRSLARVRIAEALAKTP